jgi:hypothetical protein
MSEKRSPSARSAAKEGASALTNCGSRLGKNTAIFGFVRLLNIPCRRALPWLTRDPATPAMLVEGCDRIADKIA